MQAREAVPTVEFRDDDPGYYAWIDEHPSGFVLNTRRHPDPGYLTVHRASCSHVSRLHAGAETFMGQYMKVCAEHWESLADWGLGVTGGDAAYCSHCAPRKPPSQGHVKHRSSAGTIWDLLAAAVSELDEPFGRSDVLRWFATHHPDVNRASVSTHLQFATSNAAPGGREGFSNRTPLVTRVGRGQYVAFRADHTLPEQPLPVEPVATVQQPKPSPHQQPPSSSTDAERFDIVLVGCGKSKQQSPAPAAELYTSGHFANRRTIADSRGRSWFILSAEHGLVAPDEWLAPYDLVLAATDTPYRQAWGRWVVARLQHKRGSLRGCSVLVLAPAAYADAIRPHLDAAGAHLAEPLQGLTQGEQNSWLAAQARSCAAAGTSATDLPRLKATDSQTKAGVAAALLAYRDSTEHVHETRLGYAETAEADALLQSDPFAFLLGVILDEGIKAERAWQGPLELKRRLGHLDPHRLRGDPEQIRTAVATRPSLHRYVELMSSAIALAADRVCSEYDGDASAIWATGSSAAEVDARLRRFKRIGPKKAAMAVELLVSHFGVVLSDLTGSNVAYDVHVRRVFLRSGLVEVDNIGVVTAAARDLNPDRPGLLDLPTWLIGRGWCHSRNPDCPDCPIRDSCPQLTERNVRSG